MKKRRLVTLGMCAAMAMSLAACGGSSSETETTAAGGEAAEGAETAGGSGEKLIIYTNSGSDGRDVWLEERAASVSLSCFLMIEVIGQGISYL